MVNLLIVSKDRACQLDLAFRSILKNFCVPYNATVLYTYSNDFYKAGYDVVIEIYKDRFNFVKESNFKRDVLGSIRLDNKYFTSLGDDVLVNGKIEHTKEFEVFDNDESILALNYRMGPNVEVVYEGDPPQQLPEFSADSVWNWSKCKEKDWYYPMALMGQFYRTADMISYLPNLAFNNPNSLEGAMMRRIMKHKPFMICFEESKIVELAVNRVQNVAPNNRFGNIGIEELNNKLLSGYRIKLSPLLKLSGRINRYFNVDFEYDKRK